MRLRPYGADGVLVETPSTAAALALHRAVRDEPTVVESVPGARTVLIVFDPAADRTGVLERAAARTDHAPPDERPPVEIAVRYDGPDLAPTAAELGLTTDELVRRHCGAAYVVGFCGFSPGFAYLAGLPAELHVPRLPRPRTAVPAGSVAIAGEFAGVYPRRSPGGWRLLGRTDAPLWDVTRTPPALLAPGTPVRFLPAG